ncbi:hypothetical protein EV714DRAFT_239377 [Schizophyllum commune]
MFQKTYRNKRILGRRRPHHPPIRGRLTRVVCVSELVIVPRVALVRGQKISPSATSAQRHSPSRVVDLNLALRMFSHLTVRSAVIPFKARPFVFPSAPQTAYIRFGSVLCASSLAFGPFHRSLERIVLGSILGRVLSRAAPALVLSFAVGAERTELALSAEKTELALEASSTKPILDPPTTKLALHVVTVQILPFCLALRLAKTHRRATYIRMVVETGGVRANGCRAYVVVVEEEALGPVIPAVTLQRIRDTIDLEVAAHMELRDSDLVWNSPGMTSNSRERTYTGTPSGLHPAPASGEEAALSMWTQMRRHRLPK